MRLFSARVAESFSRSGGTIGHSQVSDWLYWYGITTRRSGSHHAQDVELWRMVGGFEALARSGDATQSSSRCLHPSGEPAENE